MLRGFGFLLWGCLFSLAGLVLLGARGVLGVVLLAPGVALIAIGVGYRKAEGARIDRAGNEISGEMKRELEQEAARLESKGLSKKEAWDCAFKKITG